MPEAGKAETGQHLHCCKKIYCISVRRNGRLKDIYLPGPKNVFIVFYQR